MLTREAAGARARAPLTPDPGASAAGPWPLRLLASVPDRVVVLLLCLAIASTAGTLTGQFRPVVVLPLTVVLGAATWRMVPQAPGSPGPAAAGTVAAAALALTWVLVNAPYASQHLLVLRDPGFLTLSGVWLSEHPTPDLPLSETTRYIGALNPDISAVPAAYFWAGDVLHVQGSPLLPSLLGSIGWVAGAQGVLAGNLLLGGVALLAVYALARRLVGPWWALLPVVALGVSVPMTVFSRGAYTEPVAMAFVFGGLSVAWAALGDRRPTLHVLAGGLAGAAALARIDGSAVVIGLVLGVGLAAAAALTPRRRSQLRGALGLQAAGSLAMTLLGWLALRVSSPDYLEDLRGQFILLSGALAAALLVVLVLTLRAPWQRWRNDLLRHRRPAAWVAAGLVVLAGVALASRPWWYQGHGFSADSPYADAVAHLQEREGQPVDGTRTYDELSLTWVSWYHGWPFVVLAVLGLAVAAHQAVRRRDPRWWTVLAAVAAPSVLYLWQVSITPDQVWAMRRLLPVTLPGFAVLATVTLVALWSVHRWWARALAVLAAAAVIAAPLTTWNGLFRVVEQDGRLGEAQAVCDALRTDRVLYVRTGPPYLATVRSVCGVDGLEMTSVPDADRLADLRRDWGAFDVVAFADGAVPWEGGSAPPPLRVTSTTSWERGLLHIPEGYTEAESELWVGTVRPDGTVRPAAG
ncbi:hypothetical protein [Cellulomonas pakistanensis]|uniref:Glycosyltransferase RgtA/B/C/D-like domain-containing protein n=1 Tax=Cellulomonas pakistanensis TaxID=992287 RepID=A0A919PBC5_9CELL|nr:hypothetical protein [Cellulomonas pakistanensis]GIG35132.1 hypothetical protein Cpa01nite_05130 [Cellulomonas pakistanensis]